MDINNLDQSVFAIDPDHLDIEWQKQSTTCFEFCRLAAQAKLVVEDLKRQLDLKYAEADTAVRRDPTKFGFASTQKPTETSIASAVKQLPEIQDLTDQIAKAKYNFELCQAAVTALDHKKRGLESLTQLRAMNYYGTK